MAFEVEIKARIKDEQQMRSLFKKRFQYVGTQTKHDQYYKRHNSEDCVTRLRVSEVGAFATIKSHGMKAGVAVNKEIEFSVSDAAAFAEFLQELGMHPCANKIKYVELYTDGDLNYELVRVDPLGWFVEIEKIVRSELETESARLHVSQALFRLGIEPEQVETASYRDLL